MQIRQDKLRSETGAGAPEIRRIGPGETAVIDSATLFRGSREITIHHEGSLYRMKITRQGKLILNK